MSNRKNILICTLALLHLALVSSDHNIDGISDPEELNLDENARTRVERNIGDIEDSNIDPENTLERVERDLEQEDDEEDSVRVERDIETLDTTKYGKNKKAPSYRELYKKHFIKKSRDEKEKAKEMRLQRKMAQIKLIKFEHEKRKSIQQEKLTPGNAMFLPFFKSMMQQRSRRQAKPAVPAAPAKPAVPAKPGAPAAPAVKAGAVPAATAAKPAAPAVAAKPGAPAATPAKAAVPAAPAKPAVPAGPAKPVVGALPAKLPVAAPAKVVVPALAVGKLAPVPALKPGVVVPGKPGVPATVLKPGGPVVPGKPGAVLVTAAPAKPAGGGYVPNFGAKPALSPLAAIFSYSEDQSVTEDIEALLKAAEKEMESGSVTAPVNPFNLDGLVGGFLGGLANGIGPSTAEGGDGAETTTAAG